MTQTNPEQWAVELWRDACQASQDAFYAADGMFANDPEAIQQSRYSDHAAALAIQAAFAEREARLVGALELARPILASTSPRMGVVSNGKIVTAGQAFDAVMEALAALKDRTHG